MLGSCVLPNSGDRVYFASVSTVAGGNILFFPSLLGSFDLQHCTLWLVGHVQKNALMGEIFHSTSRVVCPSSVRLFEDGANRHGHTTVSPPQRASGLSSTDRRSEARGKDCRRTRGRRGRRERSGELRRPAAAWRLSDGLFFPLGVLETRNR